VDYFLNNFGTNIKLTVIAGVVSFTAACLVAIRQRRRGRPALGPAARVLTVGSVAMIVTATTSNGFGSGGGFEWTIGDSGLGSWRTDLGAFPETIQSVLLVGNVALYVPLGFFALFGWRRENPLVVLATCLAVSAIIEALQTSVLRGVGSADDFILNAIGMVTGWILGSVAVRLMSFTHDAR
jgi:hypothetical protein